MAVSLDTLRRDMALRIAIRVDEEQVHHLTIAVRVPIVNSDDGMQGIERSEWRFDRFELNLETGELRKAGRQVRVQEKPITVLAALLERHGHVVTRQELRIDCGPPTCSSTSRWASTMPSTVCGSRSAIARVPLDTSRPWADAAYGSSAS